MNVGKLGYHVSVVSYLLVELPILPPTHRNTISNSPSVDEILQKIVETGLKTTFKRSVEKITQYIEPQWYFVPATYICLIFFIAPPLIVYSKKHLPVNLLVWEHTGTNIIPCLYKRFQPGADLENFMTVAHRMWLVSRRGQTKEFRDCWLWGWLR